jgi:hypothetical protein
MLANRIESGRQIRVQVPYCNHSKLSVALSVSC